MLRLFNSVGWLFTCLRFLVWFIWLFVGFRWWALFCSLALSFWLVIGWFGCWGGGFEVLRRL